MKKTVIEISKMDCPSEENLIRMKLNNDEDVAHLDFDLPNRRLTVFHQGTADLILKSILELNLGGKLLSNEESNQTQFDENNQQRKLLWTVLLINFAFFGIELSTGLISKSMGLVADSLDMLADAFVGYLRALTLAEFESPDFYPKMREQLAVRSEAVLGADVSHGVLITEFLLR